MAIGQSNECGHIDVNDAETPRDHATISVVIPSFNQAHFLADAIKSVLAQTRTADEIIVVDDGSTDDPGSVAAKFPKIQFIRQTNRGPSAARNAGLRSSKSNYIVFLDADDRLLPSALEAGLACIIRLPECAFVYGGYRLISEKGNVIGPDFFTPIDGDAHLAFLRGASIAVPASAIYRRDCLLAVGGFDESLRRSEDYDLYLRLVWRYPIASHPAIVAEYRRHGQNVTNNIKRMYQAGAVVLERHKARVASDPVALGIIVERLAIRRSEFAGLLISQAGTLWRANAARDKVGRNVFQAAQLSPLRTMRQLLSAILRRVEHKFLAHLPDKLAILYHFVSRHGYAPSLRNPKTFNEWLNRKILFDRNPLLTLTTDKLAVRDYVRQRCGESILIPLLDAVDSVEALDFDRLPDKFVLKPTHASGLVEIVKDRALIDKNELLIRLNAWLKLDFYAAHREWQYKNVPRRIIVEEALLDVNDQPPHNCKFYVFHGAVQMIHVDVGRFSTHLRSLFDRNWNLLNVTYRYPCAGDQPKPLKLDEMIAIAEALGRDFEFARIDLYAHDGRIYFGEITLTPGAGLETFNPQEFDRALGEVLSKGGSIPAHHFVNRQLFEHCLIREQTDQSVSMTP